MGEIAQSCACCQTCDDFSISTWFPEVGRLGRGALTVRAQHCSQESWNYPLALSVFSNTRKVTLQVETIWLQGCGGDTYFLLTVRNAPTFPRLPAAHGGPEHWIWPRGGKKQKHVTSSRKYFIPHPQPPRLSRPAAATKEVRSHKQYSYKIVRPPSVVLAPEWSGKADPPPHWPTLDM